MLRIQSVWTGVGAIGYTSHYFDSDNVADAPECHDAVADFWNACKNIRPPDTSVTVQAEVLNIDYISGVTQGAAIETPVVVAGSAAAQQRVPDAAQVLLRLRTPGFRFGRRVRGRMFLPGTAIQFNQAGNFGSTGPATVQAAAVALRNAADLFSAPWVVWSRPRRVDENTQIPGFISPVEDSSVWTEFAVLRSRRG